MDGDRLELPNSLSMSIAQFRVCRAETNLDTAFTCVHLCKEPPVKMTIFEPTPPVQPAEKVSFNLIIYAQPTLITHKSASVVIL